MSNPLAEQTYFLISTTDYVQSLRTLHRSTRGWHYYWLKGSPEDPGQRFTTDPLELLGAILLDHQIRTVDPLVPGPILSTTASEADVAVYQGVDLFDCFGRSAFVRPASPLPPDAVRARGEAALPALKAWLEAHDAMLPAGEHVEAILGL